MWWTHYVYSQHHNNNTKKRNYENPKQFQQINYTHMNKSILDWHILIAQLFVNAFDMFLLMLWQHKSKKTDANIWRLTKPDKSKKKSGNCLKLLSARIIWRKWNKFIKHMCVQTIKGQPAAGMQFFNKKWPFLKNQTFSVDSVVVWHMMLISFVVILQYFFYCMFMMWLW